MSMTRAFFAAMLALVVLSAIILGIGDVRLKSVAQPTTFIDPYRSLLDLERDSELVVRGMFKSTPPPSVGIDVATEYASLAHHETTFEVTKFYKGQAEANIRIAQRAIVLANTMKEKPTGLENQFFGPNSEYILFLRKSSNGNYYWITGHQGAFRVNGAKVSSRNALGETKTLGDELRLQNVDLSIFEKELTSLVIP